jgi:hypothetical protein
MDRDEIREEIEQIEHDNGDEKGRMEALIDYVQLVAAKRPPTVPVESQEPELADEQEFLIRVYENMACAYGEIPAKLLPKGNMDRAILKMAPLVAAWLLEDYDIIEKE